MRERALKSNAKVRTLLGQLKALGCDPGPLREFIECRGSSSQMMGGFSTGEGPRVLMMEENLPYQSAFDATLVHELVHAYDQCRAAVDWSNRYHLACSEVRASSLSGECGFVHELNRGHLGFLKHHQACVRRRAALSVALAYENNEDGAKKKPSDADVNAVAAVYARCYRDTAPFTREDIARPASLAEKSKTTALPDLDHD